MIAETIGGVCRLVTGLPEQAAWTHTDDVACVYYANHASHLDFVLIW